MDKTTAATLRMGAEALYLDAEYYAHAYDRRRSDLAFYAALAKRHGGRVLELGVGTGRVAFELARSGHHVTGVEKMPQMLKRAKAHAAHLPAETQQRLSLVRGDMRNFRNKRRYGVVIAPFNVLTHCYTRTDLERTLRTVKHHLVPKGRFALEVLMPDLRSLLRNPDKLYRGRNIRHPRDQKPYAYAETFHYDALNQVQTSHILLDPLGHDGPAEVTPLAQRQFFPAELEALLHYNGFQIEHRYGDFEGSPLLAESPSQVIIAKPE